MTKNEYNGWTNYETWNVALWLDNEQSTQNYWSERAQELVKESSETSSEIFTRGQKAIFALADELKADFEEANPLADQATVWADLMNAALSEVNWDEIAKHYVEAVESETKEESAE